MPTQHCWTHLRNVSSHVQQPTIRRGNNYQLKRLRAVQLQRPRTVGWNSELHVRKFASIFKQRRVCEHLSVLRVIVALVRVERLLPTVLMCAALIVRCSLMLYLRSSPACAMFSALTFVYTNARDPRYSASMGRGVCDVCEDFTTGASCELCQTRFYRNPSNVNVIGEQDPTGATTCLACECDAAGAVNGTLTNCVQYPSTVAGAPGLGQCTCKSNTRGRACSECAPQTYVPSPHTRTRVGAHTRTPIHCLLTSKPYKTSTCHCDASRRRVVVESGVTTDAWRCRTQARAGVVRVE